MAGPPGTFTKRGTSPSQFFRRAIEQCESLSCPGCALCCTPTRETTDEKNKFKRGSSSAPPEDPASDELHEEDNYESWEETMRMQAEGRKQRKTFAYGR